MSTEHINWILQNSGDYYGVLQLKPNADVALIRKKYYILALKLHPDKNGGNTQANEAFKCVRRAYDTLTDTRKKYIYDHWGERGLDMFEHSENVEISVSLFCCAVLFSFLFLCCEMAAHAEQRIEFIDKEVMEWYYKKIGKVAYTMPDNFENNNRHVRAIARECGKRLFYVMTCLFVLCVAVSLLYTHNNARSEWRREHTLFPEGHGLFVTPSTFTYNVKDLQIDTHNLTVAFYSELVHNFYNFNSINVNHSISRKDEYNNTGYNSDSFVVDPVIKKEIWKVHQYYGTPEDGTRALDAYLYIRCEKEFELLYASMQRYNATSSLPRAKIENSNRRSINRLSHINNNSRNVNDINYPCNSDDNLNNASEHLIITHKCNISTHRQCRSKTKNKCHSEYTPQFTVKTTSQLFTLSSLCKTYLTTLITLDQPSN